VLFNTKQEGTPPFSNITFMVVPRETDREKWMFGRGEEISALNFSRLFSDKRDLFQCILKDN